MERSRNECRVEWLIRKYNNPYFELFSIEPPYYMIHSPCQPDRYGEGRVDKVYTTYFTGYRCLSCKKSPPKYIFFQWKLLNGK